MAVDAQRLRDEFPSIFGSAVTYPDAFLNLKIAAAELEIDRTLIYSEADADQLIIYLAASKVLFQQASMTVGSGIQSVTAGQASITYATGSSPDELRSQAGFFFAEYERLARLQGPAMDVSGSRQ